MGDEQDAFVLAVGKILRINRRGIAVAKVDLPALGLGDLGGQRDLGAWRLHTVFVSAQPLHMHAVRQRTPRHVLELIPLLEEIVAAMVADFLDRFAVRDADIADVRRVNDQLAAISQNGLELVHTFAGGPKLVVHLRRTGEDRVEWLFHRARVTFGGKVGGRGPRLLDWPGKQAAHAVALDDHAKGELGNLHHCTGAVDDLAHWRPLVADDFWGGDHGAEPVEKVQYLRPGDAGEEVFVAAGKADHLVRENRPDDHDVIVVEQLGIDLHRHVHLKQSAAEVADFVGGNDADVFERTGVVPRVIEKLHRSVLAGALVVRDLQPLLNRRLAHGLMRAQRDHDIERRRDTPDLLVDRLKHRPHRRRARGIGDD